jgi:hypothetical protein
MAKTKIAGNDELNVHEAAYLLSMSPELILWLTTHSPKSGDKRKLKIARTVEGVAMFEKSELLSFNKWLMDPWPSAPNKRPTIPTGIHREIENETATLCAICHQFPHACEAAHIDPVAQSKNNHPHNLILLCANHHTMYDKGVYGAVDGWKDFVKDWKRVLLARARMSYQLQASAVREAFHLLETGRRASEIKATTSEQKKLLKEVGEQILNSLALVKKKKPTKKDDEGYDAFARLEQITSSTAFVKEVSVTKRLRALTSVREEFRVAAGMVKCPLCDGTGNRHGEDCPFCGGEGAVTERLAEVFDERDYDYVPCPVCGGTGDHRIYDECPVCHGDREMERRIAEQIDLSEYEWVDCPLCEGEGSYEDSDECPYCSGHCEVERKVRDAFDPSVYALTECDLCEGECVAEGYDTCPKCGGEGRLPGRDAERIDKRDFQLVKCPICEGTGHSEYGDCGTCGGERRIPRHVARDL